MPEPPAAPTVPLFGDTIPLPPPPPPPVLEDPATDSLAPEPAPPPPDPPLPPIPAAP